jgi:hypothetical protein
MHGERSTTARWQNPYQVAGPAIPGSADAGIIRGRGAQVFGVLDDEAVGGGLADHAPDPPVEQPVRAHTESNFSQRDHTSGVDREHGLYAEGVIHRSQGAAQRRSRGA